MVKSSGKAVRWGLLLLILSLAGCGTGKDGQGGQEQRIGRNGLEGQGQESQGIMPVEDIGQGLVWYEKHMGRNGTCRVIAATKDGTYVYYYKDDSLTAFLCSEAEQKGGKAAGAESLGTQ